MYHTHGHSVKSIPCELYNEPILLLDSITHMNGDTYVHAHTHTSHTWCIETLSQLDPLQLTNNNNDNNVMNNREREKKTSNDNNNNNK